MKKETDKQKYNRKRRFIFCALALSTVIVACLLVILTLIADWIYHN